MALLFSVCCFVCAACTLANVICVLYEKYVLCCVWCGPFDSCVVTFCVLRVCALYRVALVCKRVRGGGWCLGAVVCGVCSVRNACVLCVFNVGCVWFRMCCVCLA